MKNKQSKLCLEYTSKTKNPPSDNLTPSKLAKSSCVKSSSQANKGLRHCRFHFQTYPLETRYSFHNLLELNITKISIANPYMSCLVGYIITSKKTCMCTSFRTKLIYSITYKYIIIKRLCMLPMKVI